MVEGGPRWIPPSMTALGKGRQQTAAQRGGEAKDKDKPLSDLQRDRHATQVPANFSLLSDYTWKARLSLVHPHASELKQPVVEILVESQEACPSFKPCNLLRNASGHLKILYLNTSD